MFVFNIGELFFGDVPDGTDDENYFLFVGKQCDNPNNYLTAYDEMWDDLPY